LYLGDSLRYHNGMMFTTVTRDNDQQLEGNCAVFCEAPWWHKNCHKVLLTGHYGADVKPYMGIRWFKPLGDNEFAKKAVMKIRPVTTG